MLKGPREPDPVAGGSALLFWSKIAGNAGFFLAVLILARALGPTGRGTIAFITVTALVAARLAGLGITEATTVFVARRIEARGALLVNAVAFLAGSALFMGALACGALIILGDHGPAGIGAPELAVIVAATLVSALGDAGYSVLLGCERLRPLALITATASWVYPVFLLAIWSTVGLTVLRAAVAWTVAESIRAAAYLAQSKRGLIVSRLDPGLLVEAVRFGSRAWVGSLSRFLNFRMDQILMGFLATEAALGVYAVAVNASEVLLYLPAAMATALLPAAARTEAGLRVEQALRAFRSAALVTTAAALAGRAARPGAAAARLRRSVRRIGQAVPVAPARRARLHGDDRLLQRSGGALGAGVVLRRAARVARRRDRPRPRAHPAVRRLGRRGRGERRIPRRRLHRTDRVPSPDPVRLARALASQAQRPRRVRCAGAAAARGPLELAT